jgi:hypothetical protein
MTPESAYSAASIAKAFNWNMGIEPPAQKFQLDDRKLGVCMESYHGGRSESRIRHLEVPSVYVDFVSQYPTVNNLLGLWDVLTAKELHVRGATRQVRSLLSSLTLDRLFDPRSWRKLKFFALVQPEGDILPVRTVYGNDRAGVQTNIGLNPLTSVKPVWYAGPDIVASFLLTGRVPRIIRAIGLKPIGKQRGMKTIELGNGRIDPYRDDFFLKVIEERKSKEKTDPLYYFLKILANAGCYGIYAEVNRQQSGKNDRRTVHIFTGEEHRTQRTNIIEQPGPWYFPPISALITAGGRLLLAMLERMVTDAGGTYLMCDTDSMAIVASASGGLVRCEGGSFRLDDGREAVLALSWPNVRKIVKKFEQLNPYDRRIVPGSILNIVKEINFDSNGYQRQLYGIAISAKRYALFIHEGSTIRLIKASEHGLGLYYRPTEGRDRECDTALWISEGWLMLVQKALGIPFEPPAWLGLPVMRRIAISTPNVMTALRKLDREQARPYNFALSPVITSLSGERILLLGPFVKNATRWRTMPYVNIYDGKVHTLDPPTLLAVVHTFDLMFAQYWRHPEFKSLAPDGSPCKADTLGLLKRCPVTATGFHFIGKETERGWEQDDDVSTLLPSLIRYENDAAAVGARLQQILLNTPLDALEAATDLSRHTLVRARRGRKVHPKSLERLRIATRKVCTSRVPQET